MFNILFASKSNQSIEIKISSIFRWMIVFLAVASLISYSLLEYDHSYIDNQSIGLIMLFALVLYMASGRFADAFPPVLIITFLLMLFVELRDFVLINVPDSLIHASRINPEIFNTTMEYIIAATVAAYLGVALGCGTTYSRRKQINTGESEQVNLRFVFYTFVVLLIVYVLIYYVFEYPGASGSGEHLSFFQRYIARLIYPQAWLIMLFTGYGLSQQKSKYTRLFIISCGLYLLYFPFIGSRSGIFEVLILLIGYRIVFYGNAPLRFSRWQLIGLISLVPVSLLLYKVATVIRWILWYQGDGGISAILDDQDGFNLLQFISEVSYRLSFIEPTMFPIFSTDIGLNDISDLVNVHTTWLSTLNRLIPGKPWGEILFSEYAFGFLYYPIGNTIVADTGRIDYVGYEWSMFGIAYQLFGFMGGVGFLFVFTAMLSSIISFFQKRASFFSLTCCIFMLYTLSVWVRNMGIDNFVDRTIHTLIVITFGFVFYRIAASSSSKGLSRAI